MPQQPTTAPTDEVHFVPTAGGWQLAVSRLLPRGGAAHATPIILCHGLSGNRLNFDMDAESSFARGLSSTGYDVFMVDLRGSGLSRRDHASLSDEERRQRHDFDDYIKIDIPTVIRAVVRISEKNKVFWLGHSLGGMLGYVVASGACAAHLRGLITVSSPTLFDSQATGRRRLLQFGQLLFPSRIPVRTLSRAWAPFSGWLVPRSISEKTHMKGLATPTKRLALRTGVSDITLGELAHIAMWYKQGHFCSRAGNIDYFAGLQALQLPTLVIGGSADRVCPLPVLKQGFAQIGAVDKELIVASKANGFSRDYGHVDIVMSGAAKLEIFPRIVSWLDAHLGF